MIAITVKQEAVIVLYSALRVKCRERSESNLALMYLQTIYGWMRSSHKMKLEAIV